MADDRRRPVGIGGWLAFFVLTLTVLGPLRALWGIYRHLYADPTVAIFYGRSWRAVEVLTWSSTLVSIAWLEFLGWRLVAVRTRATVRLVVPSLWIVATLPSVVATAGVSVLSGVEPAAIVRATGWALGRPMIYAAIWTAYLLRSERVANTYPTTAETDRLAAVFD